MADDAAWEVESMTGSQLDKTFHGEALVAVAEIRGRSSRAPA